MYIPPGFTVITCDYVDEEAFRAWAADLGGVWHPKEGKPHRRAHVTWEFHSGCDIAAHLGTPSEKESAAWTPWMYTPPQSIIDVEVEPVTDTDDEQWMPTIRALFAQWGSYAYDPYAYDPDHPGWIGALLHDILPPERIIHYEPPSLSAGPAWIWVNGIYKKNEAYYDNLDAAAHENQL